MEQVTCSSCSCLFHPMCQDIPTASFGNFGNVNIANATAPFDQTISRIRHTLRRPTERACLGASRIRFKSRPAAKRVAEGVEKGFRLIAWGQIGEKGMRTPSPLS